MVFVGEACFSFSVDEIINFVLVVYEPVLVLLLGETEYFLSCREDCVSEGCPGLVRRLSYWRGGEVLLHRGAEEFGALGFEASSNRNGVGACLKEGASGDSL